MSIIGGRFSQWPPSTNPCNWSAISPAQYQRCRSSSALTQ
ncbi:MAG: hypothetical protein H6671_01320 [Anaerolineaceae bacterium]|nr:hypothetical protein [Anaerolineaceae bacterium]